MSFDIRNNSGGQNDGRTRKRGVCDVHFDPENLKDDPQQEEIKSEESEENGQTEIS